MRRVGGDVARRLLKRGVGGAVFRRLRRLEDASGLGKRARNGNWWGNDTIWRTTIDLNQIFYHGDAQGRLVEQTSRRVLNVYDGIVAGEGDGPMAPTPRAEGLLAMGEDGVATDVVVAWLMGFDWRRVPVLANAIGPRAGGVAITRFAGDPAALPVLWLDEHGARETTLAAIDTNLRFEAHPGWKGQIERRPEGRDPIACAS
jgi:hypothetical protein